MKKTTTSTGSLVRILIFSSVFCALFAVAGVGAASDTDPLPAIAAAEVTPVVQEPIDAPATAPATAESAQSTAPKQPAFQGLVPAGKATQNHIQNDIVTYGLEQPLGNDTHPILKITPDKSELVRLDRNAASVIVGNPDHLGVLMDSRRLLILVPRQPGATYMTILDESGAVIMQRHVIVASPQADYIRIRRSCAGQGRDCQETSVYYCPGMCHPVGVAGGAGVSGDVAPLPASRGSNENAPQGQTPDPVIPVTAGQ